MTAPNQPPARRRELRTPPQAAQDRPGARDNVSGYVDPPTDVNGPQNGAQERE